MYTGEPFCHFTNYGVKLLIYYDLNQQIMTTISLDLHLFKTSVVNSC